MKRISMMVGWVCVLMFIGNVAYGEIPEVFNRQLHIVLITEFADALGPYIEGVQEEAESLGFRLEVLDAKHDQERMAELLTDAVFRNVDGIIMSHGDAGKLSGGLKRAIRKKVPVVAAHNATTLPEITKVAYDEYQMANLILNTIREENSEAFKLFLIWVSGYPPMEKRMEVYTKFMAQHPDITEVDRFGEASSKTVLRTKIEMDSMLEQYPRGAIDVVWATWDQFAQGAANAIKGAGRTEIKLYGYDVSDEDLAMLQDPANPWITTVAVSYRMVGQVQVRMLAYKIAGKAVPEINLLPGTLLTREMFPPGAQVTLNTLDQYVPGGGGTYPGFQDSWIQELKARQKK